MSHPSYIIKLIKYLLCSDSLRDIDHSERVFVLLQFEKNVGNEIKDENLLLPGQAFLIKIKSIEAF